MSSRKIIKYHSEEVCHNDHNITREEEQKAW